MNYQSKTNQLQLARLLPLLMLLFGYSANAQYFTEAPKLNKKVKKIIEWMQLDGKVIKANTSYFDKGGRLVGYYNEKDANGEKITLKYDKYGRVIEKRIGTEDAPTVVIFSYKKNTVVREEHYRGKVFKVFEFRNDKKQMVEKKTFLKGGEMGDKFILRERYIYTYNAQDSLKGIVHYLYSLNGRGKGKTYEKQKILYTYDKRTGKRSRVVYYDIDQKPVKQTLYEYHRGGKIKRVTMASNDTIERTIEYMYNKDGSLWQEIETTSYKRFVKIYKNKRLIRQRTYIGEELFTLVDFQYEFY